MTELNCSNWAKKICKVEKNQRLVNHIMEFDRQGKEYDWYEQHIERLAANERKKRMTDFIKLTQITNWKIEKEKKEPTTTKSVYVRPQDIVSFCDDDGATLVQFADKGIHVKETPNEIFEKIKVDEYTPLTWREPISFRDNEKQGWWWGSDWWNHPTITCDTISKNTPYYGYAIVFGNGEVWE